ncbi:AraC family transcriptional regulator [Brevibacterium daeguense]|uniref:AraC family transcriptional regulator n=1 Tax=Brevibacterium daeguense TaxID=909936 RepID=A0ABP8EJL7_9MICO|nr:helix-turn-helix transcriptional regulator [Brevibacterium daeguense]
MPSTLQHADAAHAAALFVRDNLAEPLSVADIADHVGYSEFHFTRLFARAFGCSPVQYLAAQRFQRAKELLVGSDHTVSDICCAVGFSSLGTFTRRFTLEVGVSPGGIRRLSESIADRTLHAYTLDAPDVVGTMTGTVALTERARTVLGPLPQIWVGLFASPRPARRPLTGVLRFGDGGFTLRIPAAGRWLLAAAFPRDAGPHEHLTPAIQVVAASGPAVRDGEHRDLVLDFAQQGAPPLLTALPAVLDAAE